MGQLRKVFQLKKKDNTDEFLVEKKNPLKLPPDFEDLPVPNSEIDINVDQRNQEIKKLVTQNEKQDGEINNNTQKSKNLEEFLLDKIKKN